MTESKSEGWFGCRTKLFGPPRDSTEISFIDFEKVPVDLTGFSWFKIGCLVGLLEADRQRLLMEGHG